ncbi:MAG TPA: PDZ domain-containing protein [Bryobacteraceae bacterium]|jgi:serine protease Do
MFNRSIFVSILVAGASVAFAQNPIPQAAPNRTVILNMPGAGQSYLGVGLAEVDSARASQLKLKDVYGVELTHIEQDSPAAKAGLKAGDVVLEYNGQRVEGMEQFARFVRETPSGREVKLTVSRDGNRQMMPVLVGQRKMLEQKWSMTAPAAPAEPGGFSVGAGPVVAPAFGDMPSQFMIWQSPRVGIDAEAIEGQLGEFFGVKEGVLIRSVVKGSAAEKAGLKAGDVITKVDGSTVVSPGEVMRAVRSARAKKTFPITVMREKHETSINVTVDDNEDHSERRSFYFNNDGTPGGQQFFFKTSTGHSVLL